jgi:hypothetical protein
MVRTRKVPVAKLGIGVGGDETELDRWRLPQDALELFKRGLRMWLRRVTMRIASTRALVSTASPVKSRGDPCTITRSLRCCICPRIELNEFAAIHAGSETGAREGIT